MSYQISPIGSAGGCFSAYADSGGIKPLTRTIFDLNIFLYFLKGTDFALKMAHRGNIGAHKGKRKLLSLSENYICALLLFFSVFGLWHKANLLVFNGLYKKSVP